MLCQEGPGLGPSGSSPAAGPSGSSPAAGPSGSSPTAGPSGSSPAAGPSGSSPAAGPSGSSPAAGPSGSSNKRPPADIGNGLADKRAFQFDPAPQMGMGGLTPARRNSQQWNDYIKLQLGLYGAQEKVLERYFKKVTC
ncbi:peptidase M12B domain-containing protein [Haematococcus lacustris]|uniref:Peptidase M12B domain-containing protein n=1 Tax=Haematococcus lacustris TaxID=44745 RepID=A0A699ZQ67_HAELA|nr:peptidase M12B domain-containing protein [Haematococcus lacustris]